MVKINGSSLALQYKRTTSRPIDSSEVFDTIEDARVYARNSDTEPYVPYAGQIITVVENGGTYQLVKDSTIPESDGKKHFKLVPIGNKNDTDDAYLSKVNEDTAKALIHFLKGIEALGLSSLEDIKLIGDLLSSNYSKGSTGFGIYKDEQGKYHLDIDDIFVRGKFSAETIEVKQSYHVQGAQYLTKAGLIVKSVSGNTVTFSTTDADGKVIYNQFAVGDYAYHKDFNMKTSRVYWYEVTGVGTDSITMNITGDVPRVGDSIVQLGNKSDKSRQAAIILDSDGIVMYKGISSMSLPVPYIEMGDSGVVFRGKFISEATGKDVDDSLKEITKEVTKIKEQSDKSFVIWFADYMPTLENEPASLWTDDATREEHEQDVFYNTSAKAGSGGRAFRYEKNESGVYSWNEITDKDTLAALEQVAAADKKADNAQNTANSKKRVFVDTPDSKSVYDIGDLWVNAVYDDGTTIYKNDSLVCITSKVEGEAFSISHWKPSSMATTAYLENLGNQIIIAVSDAADGIEAAKKLAEQGISDAYDAAQSAMDALGIAKDAQGKADKNTAAIVVTNDSISALVQGIHFDAKGNITNIDTSGLVTEDGFNALLSKKVTFDAQGHVSNISTSGLVTEAGFAQMFSEKAMADGYVVRADISTFITDEDAGRLISNAKISADNIIFEGSTVKISADMINFDGSTVKINADNIDFEGSAVKISADNIDFDGSTVKISADNIELNGEVIAKAIKLEGLNINDNFIVYKDGKVKMQGKFSTSFNGNRIEINPDTNLIEMYNENEHKIATIGVERRGEAGSLYTSYIELYYKESNGDVISRLSMSTSGIIFEDRRFGNDIYKSDFSPFGINFYKNGKKTQGLSNA